VNATKVIILLIKDANLATQNAKNAPVTVLASPAFQPTVNLIPLGANVFQVTEDLLSYQQLTLVLNVMKTA
jgi:hypothetical protein